MTGHVYSLPVRNCYRHPGSGPGTAGRTGTPGFQEVGGFDALCLPARKTSSVRANPKAAVQGRGLALRRGFV